MTDRVNDEVDRADAARMMLDPDALHEGEDQYFIDCPECGSSVTLERLVRTGRCSGYLGADETEVADDDREASCTARLALELVWES